MSAPATEPQSDAELMASWDAVTDPLEMLKAVDDGAWFLGGDPYYNDLVSALLRNVGRVIELKGHHA